MPSASVGRVQIASDYQPLIDLVASAIAEALWCQGKDTRVIGATITREPHGKPCNMSSRDMQRIKQEWRRGRGKNRRTARGARR